MKRREIVIAVLALSLIFGIGFLSYAQDDDHATGYIPPTPEEADFFVKTHPKVIKVLSNKIGLERINKGRLAQGLSPLSGEGLTEIQGGDIISAIPGKSPNKTLAQGIAPSQLPVYVDNSQLPAFPVIRSQGSLGSCASFSSTYYQMTHMAGLMYGWDNKNEDNTNKFSPRWTYNFVNNGDGTLGSGMYDIFNVLEGSGAATWQEFPYDGVDFRQWCMEPSVWEHAINYRINPIQLVTDADTSVGLEQMKTLLNNGYVLIFGTAGMSNWQWTRIKDDRSTSEDDAFVGKDIAYWMNGNITGHALTIVGYNDAIWCDVNNNKRVDAGEKGALRIANSWGTGWKESGFSWVAYDALKQISGVSGGPSTGRIAIIDYNLVYVMTLRDHYAPTLLVKFTVNHAKRNQLRINLGISETVESDPSIKWYPGVFSLLGGEYAFDGSTTSATGTFVLDFSDILTPPGDASKKYYLGMLDSIAGSPATLSSFKLIDKINNSESQEALTDPLTVDQGSADAQVDFAFGPLSPTITNNPPVATAMATPVSGPAPLTVHFTGSGIDGDGTITDKVWYFGERGRMTGSLSEVTDYQYVLPGVYSAKFTVKDDLGAESSDAALITVDPDPSKAMHVSNISMSVVPAGNKKYATAALTILNGNGTPVSGATVSGVWSGLTTDTESGTTNGSGNVTFNSNSISKSAVGMFTFCVDDVVLTNYYYSPADNVETCDSIETVAIVRPR